jgi:hypothetical protein
VLLADGILFIHAPKTAGTSVVEFLVRNLPGDKILSMPRGHWAQKGAQVVEGKRHEDLAEALHLAEQLGTPASRLRMILAVIRNPYDLEVSRYAYFQQGHRWDDSVAARIARAGDFDRFCREAGYPWGRQTPIENWYTLDGHIPERMRLLRFESLDRELPLIIGPLAVQPRPVAHRNVTEHPDWRTYITPVNEPVIYEKYRWLFQFYERAFEERTSGGGASLPR